MRMEYKRLIMEMLDRISEADTTFLSQIYTLIKRHIEKAGNRAGNKEQLK